MESKEASYRPLLSLDGARDLPWLFFLSLEA